MNIVKVVITKKSVSSSTSSRVGANVGRNLRLSGRDKFRGVRLDILSGFLVLVSKHRGPRYVVAKAKEDREALGREIRPSGGSRGGPLDTGQAEICQGWATRQ